MIKQFYFKQFSLSAVICFPLPKLNLSSIALSRHQEISIPTWTEEICFNQDDAISSLDIKPLKFVDKFKYLGSNISSTESDVNICIGKAWTAIDRLTTK